MVPPVGPSRKQRTAVLVQPGEPLRAARAQSNAGDRVHRPRPMSTARAESSCSVDGLPAPAGVRPFKSPAGAPLGMAASSLRSRLSSACRSARIAARSTRPSARSSARRNTSCEKTSSTAYLLIDVSGSLNVSCDNGIGAPSTIQYGVGSVVGDGTNMCGGAANVPDNWPSTVRLATSARRAPPVAHERRQVVDRAAGYAGLRAEAFESGGALDECSDGQTFDRRAPVREKVFRECVRGLVVLARAGDVAQRRVCHSLILRTSACDVQDVRSRRHKRPSRTSRNPPTSRPRISRNSVPSAVVVSSQAARSASPSG